MNQYDNSGKETLSPFQPACGRGWKALARSLSPQVIFSLSTSSGAMCHFLTEETAYFSVERLKQEFGLKEDYAGSLPVLLALFYECMQ